ncbi:AEC family transporter [Myxococcota bacterium]|nr:AEC family transporter [Myxococcota bacterium]MBU1380934.1 AEC family transporter [Myxococcota bacterium]MBU1498486.1 AEC family transporter [Myxococcota bacterium]
MSVTQAIISVNLPILIGYLSRTSGLLAETDTAALRRFVIQVTVPFIIFSNLYKSDISNVSQLLPSAASLFILSSLFIVFALFVSARRFNPIDRSGYVIATMFGNYGYLGWGVMHSFYGETGFSRGVFFTVLSWPIFLFLGFKTIHFLEKDSGETDSQAISFGKILLKNAALPVSSVVLALSLNYFKVPLHTVIAQTIDRFAAITIPLILFTIGMAFHFRISREKLPVILIGSVSRIIPGFIFGLVTVFSVALILPMDIHTKKMVLLQSVMPTATVAAFFAEFSSAEDETVAAILTFSTLGALITLPAFYILIEHVITPFL